MKLITLIILFFTLTFIVEAKEIKQYNIKNTNNIKNTKDIVSKTLWLESSNQSTLGKKCVASVIYNRAKGNPKDLTKVCLAKKQFSCWNKNKPDSIKIKPNISYNECTSFANDMVIGKFQIVNGFYGVNYYHEKKVKPKWAKTQWFVCKIGDHLFYRIPA